MRLGWGLGLGLGLGVACRVTKAQRVARALLSDVRCEEG